MCRYAYSGPYKSKFACFSCRKMFKQDLPSDRRHEWEKDLAGTQIVVCPECKGKMHNMGLDFKAPRQSDVKQWRKVELLHAKGFAYHSCGCGPGFRPKLLREVPEFLKEEAQNKQDYIRAQEIYKKEQALELKRNKRIRELAKKRQAKIIQSQLQEE